MPISEYRKQLANKSSLVNSSKASQVHISSSVKWCHCHHHEWHRTTLSIYETLCLILRLAEFTMPQTAAYRRSVDHFSQNTQRGSPAHGAKLMAFSLQHPSFSHSPRAQSCPPLVFRSAVWLTGALTITPTCVMIIPELCKSARPGAVCAEGESKDGSKNVGHYLVLISPRLWNELEKVLSVKLRWPGSDGSLGSGYILTHHYSNCNWGGLG